MNSDAPVQSVLAEVDSALSVRIVRRVPMYYEYGADATLDRSAHVRAASGLAWAGDRLAVVQDDANFIALVNVATGLAESLNLPADAFGNRLFDDGRGNKAGKYDFESVLATVLPDGIPVLMAFGSGSTPHRESIAIIRLGTDVAVQVVHVPLLYEALRRCEPFAGRELNVEGVVRIGDGVRLFGRGNGDESAGVSRRNASCDVDWIGLLNHLDNPFSAPPPPRNIVQFDLGTLSGTRIAFTDIAAWRDPHQADTERLIFTGTAEDSRDVVQDGAVAGSVVGIIRITPTGIAARWCAIRDVGGALIPAKVEGIVVGDSARGQLFVVVDADDYESASELWELEMTHGVEPW